MSDSPTQIRPEDGAIIISPRLADLAEYINRIIGDDPLVQAYIDDEIARRYDAGIISDPNTIQAGLLCFAANQCC